MSNTEIWKETSLRREVARHAKSIAVYASRLEQRLDYPNSAPKDLARLVGETCEVIHESMADTPAHMLQYLSVFLKRLWNVLYCAECSGIKSTPWSIIPSFESFMKECFEDNTSFLIWPQWDYNYSIMTMELAQTILKELGAFSWIDLTRWEMLFNLNADGPANSPKIYSISFPHLERNNTLMHTLIGHEIGHILSLSSMQNSFDQTWQVNEAKLNEHFRQEAKQSSQKDLGDLFTEALASQNVDRAKSLVLKAFSELSADSIGLHLFGPAALTASAEFAACVDIDLDPLRAEGHYPPWRYRLRSMFALLQDDIQDAQDKVTDERYAVLRPFVAWIQEIGRTVNEKADMRVINRSNVSKAAYDIIASHFPPAPDCIAASLPTESKMPYRLSNHLDTLVELVTKLEAGIPPNETGNWPETAPAELADILNAGWAYKILQLQRDPDWASYDNIEGLFLLLLKAIESAHVHRCFGPELQPEGAVQV